MALTSSAERHVYEANPLHQLADGHLTDTVSFVAFSHNGAFLASADQSGVIKYFQPNMNNLTQWTGHREAIRGLSFSPDDNRFATASDDSTIRLWSFEEQRAERTLTGECCACMMSRFCY